MKKVFTSSSLWSCLIALVMMMASQSAWAEYVKLTALSGTGGTGGEGYPSLVDAKENTKMGHSFDPNNPERDQAWIVVKAEKPVVPSWYFLVTGGDTGSYPTRNWKSWNIYGGNFASDAEAVRDINDPAAAGWTLIDERQGEPLPEANTANKNFQFNESDGATAYQYFWIEITESVQGSDIWLQMSEWGLGTYSEFAKYLEDLANQQTGTDEPVIYTIISGDRNDNSGEGLAKLFDGDISTKWGNGFSPKNYGATSGGAYFIVKTSRAMAPTYYKLVTGNDNASWNNRNWQDWQIYGMASSDVPNGKPDRASDKWVLLDRKDNITKEQLPDKNMFTVIFNLSEENTTEYQYFKVEIDKTQGAGYMQMGEFSLGDEYTLAIDRNAIVKAAEATYDPDLFAEKALIDQLGQAIEDTRNCNDPFTLGNLNATVDDLTSQVTTSASQYAELITARNLATNLINADNLKDAAMAYAQAWISETDVIAPNDNDYPVGNFGYIKANRQITGTQAVAEAKRIVEYLNANIKIIDDPIYATYTALAGSGGFGGEDHSMLIDGDRENTKWCSNSLPGWMIFKTDKPIKPSYYGLVTGGDTYSYPDRNWKSWKIYAANFDSDEEATAESDKWVLIDDKNNVGTDILRTTNKFESYINLSIGCTEPYQYFMIKDVYAWGGLMQMNEFTFYNQGNLEEYREDFISEFADYDPLESPAYKGYTDEFAAKYAELQTTGSAPDMMRLKNELKDVQELIATSVAKYEEYQEWCTQLSNEGPASEELQAWFEGYTTENVAPNELFANGTQAYILENLQLDNEAIGAAAGWDIRYDDNGKETGRTEILPSGEIGYIQSMVKAATDGTYILLGGHTEGQWGDGFYGHLIDGIALNSTEVDPETGQETKVNATKWGGQADANGNTYIIFRTAGKTNPFFYTLTTGNDTGRFYERNWGTWYIYGANFDYDTQATKDAEGWVLIDTKENIGQDRLHPVDAEPSYFGFSTETTESYTYYKVVVTKAFKGDAIQMNELHFGTEEEFEDIKQDYISAANEFDTNVVAEQSLLDEYNETVGDIDECTNMEALFRINYELETLREKITESAAAYAKYQAAVDEVVDYLEANNLDDSEAKTILTNYLASEPVAPSEELYPNGSSAYILEEHVLADSVVIGEIEFLETLKTAAVAAGYGPGMDVSSLIVNRTFKKAGEMLKDEEGAEIGREAEGWNGNIYRTATDADDNNIFAAELCVGNAKFDVNQTLTGLKNGFYKVTLNAGYRANGDVRSYNHAAMAYANDVMTYVPVVREDMAKDKETSWQGDHYDRAIYALDEVGYEPTGDAAVDSAEIGYVIWGCEGAAHAFAQGRYAITMVAKVTDGTLTIGVKNEGTKGSEWTGIGNFGLVYLGEEDGADDFIANALQDAANYNAARINTLTAYNPEEELFGQGDVYVPINIYEESEFTYSDRPNFPAVMKEALKENSGVPTYEAEVAIGETMKAVYDAKKAYAALYEAQQKVGEHWSDYYLQDEALNDDIYGTGEALNAGTYDDADAALEAKAALYEKWPDYLRIKEAYKVDILSDENLSFDLLATDPNAKRYNPYIVLYDMYEPLEKDEIILAFEYTAEQNLENGVFYYAAPGLQTDVEDSIPTLAAAVDWTPVYYNISNGIKEYKFGSATDHSIHWHFNNKQVPAGEELSLQARNFRFITMAQMKAEGGTLLNGVKGDNNEDGEVNLADAQTILGLMARDADVSENPAADVNGDNEINLADYQTVLGLMAQQ